MKIIETLDWILDNDDKSIADDDKYRLNIEFVHSLGFIIPQFCKHFKCFGSPNLSKMPLHLWLCK